ncbi:HAMP domain-containing protein [Fontibacillus phaseoli]|uniref:HAMP domain-containing protein n=1 Tax=Fontibacillus phaseoli TaxID=1416533 RepID=A0A369AWW6_9BACL|nr:HD domain-containing phosphohydrolase [Fontibacillus phaseoli]RCX13585.1 HAMP domain-containing protein [Fontibacillus phaseoli]
MTIPLTVYKTFISRLKLNYAAGTLLAVIALGSLMIFAPLDLPREQYVWLIGVLVLSLCIMFTLEWIVFSLQIRPIRNCFLAEVDNFSTLQNVYIRTHRLPALAVKRILGPHLFGLLLPATILSIWLIYIGKLSIPYYYVLLASLGVVLVAGMHALIEFYMTSCTIRPILLELSGWSLRLFGKELTLGGRVLISIRRKLKWSFFLIGAFPLLLYSLAVQFRMDDWSAAGTWQWAVLILLIGLGFSFIGSWLLTRETVLPIQHLYEKMAEVKVGYLRNGASDLFSDEFSRLVSGFNHMLRGIKIQAERNNQLLESYFATLAAALDARDPYTAGHSLRVAEYAVGIGLLAKLPEEEIHDLRKSALLHDIGKIGIRDAVLLKEGRLTEEEWEQIKQHPVLGEAILKQIEPADAMAPFLPGVRSHHERYDGKGYPDGLQGEDIPLFGRIIAVADAFDAMTSDRPYRKGLDEQQAISILEEGRGTQWDPHIAQLFVDSYWENREKKQAP